MDRAGAAPHHGNEEERIGGNENGHNERLVVAVILVGNAGVGKTSIMNRYVNSSFVPNLEERGDGDLRATPKVVNIGGREVELSFVDGSGLHEVKDQTIDNLRNYMRAIVMVYDVTDVRSFNSLNTWLRRIETNHGGEITPDCCLLVGNKIDVGDNRRVPYGMAQNWVDRRGIKHYVEMSAKRGKNVKSAIESLVVRVLEWQGIGLNFGDDRHVDGGRGGNNGGAGIGVGVDGGAGGERNVNGGVGGNGGARNIGVNGNGVGGANNDVGGNNGIRINNGVGGCGNNDVGGNNGVGPNNGMGGNNGVGPNNGMGGNNGVGGNNGNGGNVNSVGYGGDIEGEGNINDNHNGDGNVNGDDSSDDANENRSGRLKGCCWW